MNFLLSLLDPKNDISPTEGASIKCRVIISRLFMFYHVCNKVMDNDVCNIHGYCTQQKSRPDSDRLFAVFEYSERESNPHDF